MTTGAPAVPPPSGGAIPVIHLPAAALARLAPRLQQGVRVRSPAGLSVSAFLVEWLGVEADYVRRRVTTVFLDGSVVDDLEAARLRDGSRLALSAAMPGLVGATLRKGGYYAAMRQAITLAGAGAAAGPGEAAWIEVEVKLFNLLIEELGPALLAAGVALPPGEADALLGAAPPDRPGDRPDVWLRVLPG